VAGTDKDCDGKHRWCSIDKNFVSKEVKWKTGHPKLELDCVYLENATHFLATADCSEEKNFLCEVRNEGTYGKAMQEECATLWDIDTGDHRYS